MKDICSGAGHRGETEEQKLELELGVGPVKWEVSLRRPAGV